MNLVIRNIILILLLLKLDSFALIHVSEGLGSALSYLMLALLVFYYFISEKTKPEFLLLILGLSYFVISVFQYYGPTNNYIIDLIKFLVFIITASTLANQASPKEIALYLSIGSFSIIVNTIAFPNDYGRYSGFYINPNNAGLIALLGFAFAFAVSNVKLRIVFQFLCIAGGIMTLSRYFLITLTLIALLSALYKKSNLIGILFGAMAFVLVLSSGNLKLNTARFQALQSVFSDDVDTQTITKESREETWALYKTPILNHLLFGNGYKATHGHENDSVGVITGVHNTYLMVLGDSGFIPFVILIFIYIRQLVKSAKHFFKQPEHLYIALILVTFLLVSHNYFDNYIVLFFSLWLFQKNRAFENDFIKLKKE
ncbi:O-antigen ligase family protein [Mangrovimonas futianensis]|uniref:O-antigen ligase family protein n=1 Tax=Mangrovimonas futianensis TaxID=2895523 RepID=UPI001E567013|nr:O-antigen ligase family protein [Mangrovimonas futianensis]MCF1421969.1 O-antigen ligase family protein [Mangrovimonas futianensis]